MQVRHTTAIENVRKAIFSPDGNCIATGGDDGAVMLYDARSGEPLSEDGGNSLYRHKDYVRSLAFTPDGKLLASGSDDNRICLHSLATRTLLKAWPLITI